MANKVLSPLPSSASECAALLTCHEELTFGDDENSLLAAEDDTLSNDTAPLSEERCRDGADGSMMCPSTQPKEGKIMAVPTSTGSTESELQPSKEAPTFPPRGDPTGRTADCGSGCGTKTPPPFPIPSPRQPSERLSGKRKSPFSFSIENIIGAAEAIAKQERQLEKCNVKTQFSTPVVPAGSRKKICGDNFPGQLRSPLLFCDESLGGTPMKEEWEDDFSSSYTLAASKKSLFSIGESIEDGGNIVKGQNDPDSNFRDANFRGEKRDSDESQLPPVEVMLASDKELYKRLLLTMALAREKPRHRGKPSKNRVESTQCEGSTSESDDTSSGSESNASSAARKRRKSFISDGFFWKDYPVLENILRSHMGEYYELSTTKRQSKDQQVFNNRLVGLIRTKARLHGWEFDPVAFCDKKLRDRVRCWYKTHVQNAKKRLNTMLRKPDKRDNRALLQRLVKRASASSDGLPASTGQRQPITSALSSEGSNSYHSRCDNDGSDCIVSTSTAFSDESEIGQGDKHAPRKLQHNLFLRNTNTAKAKDTLDPGCDGRDRFEYEDDFKFSTSLLCGLKRRHVDTVA